MEASRVVLSSLVATASAAALLLPWLWLPIFRDLAPDLEATSAETVRNVAAVVANSLLACGLVLIIALVRWRGRAPIRRGRVWNSALASWVPNAGSSKPGVIIELTDGTTWRGLLWAFDSDPEDGHRNIAIGPPLRVRPDGATKYERIAEVGEDDQVVLLPESQIRTLRVVYLATSDPIAGGN